MFTNCSFARRSPDTRASAPSPAASPWRRSPSTHPGDRRRELRALPRPIIGYVGGLHRHPSIDLLAAMARARPHWSWSTSAPANPTSPLGTLPNVHLLGRRPHGELPRHIREFDACISPTPARLTETVVPTKINEYLAMGKPVVTTDLPALSDTPAVLRADPGNAAGFGGAIPGAIEAALTDGAADAIPPSAGARWPQRPAGTPAMEQIWR